MAAALLALALLGAEPDPLEAAHARRDPAHVLAVFRAESAIEDVNKGTVTVFGTRRELRCPGGQVVAETRCDPCVYTVDAWAEHPDDAWIFEATYADEPEHQKAARAVQHFSRYFELAPREGAEKAGVQHLLFAVGGPRTPPPPPQVSKLRVLIGGAERDTAAIPYGATGLAVEVQALAKNDSGALAPLPDADVAFSATCATIEPTAPGRARISLPSGVNACSVAITANPGGAKATLAVSRELKLEILVDGQAADEVRLDRARALELTFSAVAQGKPVGIAPQWKGEHGTFELRDGGKQVRFTLDPGASEGSVLLLDSQSGASDTLSVKRKP